MKSRSIFVLGAAAALSMTPALTGLANAAPEPNNAPDPGVDQRVSEFVTNNPGSQRVGENAVKIREGMVKRFATSPHQQQGCADGHLCLYEGVNFEGDAYDLYFCHQGPEALPADWANRTHSFQNHQTAGSVAIFYNWNAGNGQWEELSRSVAPEDNAHVDERVAKTDGVEPC